MITFLYINIKRFIVLISTSTKSIIVYMLITFKISEELPKSIPINQFNVLIGVKKKMAWIHWINTIIKDNVKMDGNVINAMDGLKRTTIQGSFKRNNALIWIVRINFVAIIIILIHLLHHFFMKFHLILITITLGYYNNSQDKVTFKDQLR